jgi:hypothetical protein
LRQTGQARDDKSGKLPMESCRLGRFTRKLMFNDAPKDGSSLNTTLDPELDCPSLRKTIDPEILKIQFCRTENY